MHFYAVAIAAAGQGRVVAAREDGSLFIIDPSFALTELRSATPGIRPAGVVADRDGNVYLIARAGETSRLLAIRSDGTLRYDIPFDGYGVADLAADQCTLVYDGTGGVRRFDVCTGMPLPGAPLPVDADRGLRILPDGGLLIASTDELERYDAGGTLVRTYTLPPMFRVTAVALGPAGARALIGPEESEFGPGVLEVSLVSGAVVRHVPLDVKEVNSIVAYRGWTAAIGSLAAEEVPSLATWALIALTVLLAGIAARKVL